MNRKLFAIALGLSFAAFSGCGGGGEEKKEEPKSTATSEKRAVDVQKEQAASIAQVNGKGNAQNGRKLYLSTCATCHGEKGDGKGPAGKGLSPTPRNFTDHKMMSAVTDEQMFKAIRGGGAAVGKSPIMPAQPQFSDKQILDIIAFERSFDKERKQ